MVSSEVTQLLGAWRAGDTGARDRLIAALYPELRRVARQLFAREAQCLTLQPTALVNEAWLRLAGHAPPDATDCSHLLAISARLMREILVDQARRRNAAKRDGGEAVNLTHPDVDGVGDGAAERGTDMLDLERALEQLQHLDAVKAQIVELRYFGGLSIEETGKVLGQSPATVKRHWQAARVWLHGAVGSAQCDPGG